MAMQLYSEPESSFLEQQGIADTYRPDFWTTFGAAFGEGLRMTSVSALADIYRTSTLFADEEDMIGEDLWKESIWSRPGLKWFRGMTEDHARILAERWEIKQQRDFILARGGTLTTFAGFMAGGVLDPVNLIPFTGGLRGAKLLSAIGQGARNNAFIEAGLQPLLAAQAERFQENYDAQMAATNILAAAGLGGAFGGLGNILGKISPTLRAFATQKAVVDVVNENPVDVSGYIGDKYDANALVRSEMKGEFRPFELPGPSGRIEDMPPVIGTIDTPGGLRTPEQQWLMDHLDIGEDTVRAMDIYKGFDLTPEKQRYLEGRGLPRNEIDFLQNYLDGPTTPVKTLDARTLPEPERIAEEPESTAQPGRLEEADEAEIRQLDEQLRSMEPERAPDAEPEARPEIKAADEAAAADVKRAKAYEDAAICLSS